jgi:hypothetical protein
MNYNKQAEEFLKKYKLNLSVRKAIPQKAPLWTDNEKEYGIHYAVSLSNISGKHYDFDYWGSVKDKEDNKGATHYSILACLDTQLAGESYEEFCDNYGYDTDSRRAMRTYKAVLKQIEGLKKVLTTEAIGELNEIN